VPADSPARKLAPSGQRPNRFDVDLEQLRELLGRQHVGLTRGHRPADHDVRSQVALNQLGDELALRRLQLERGAVELLGRGSGQPDEER
jgi:hypothetical protein